MNHTVMSFIWTHIGNNFPSYAGGATLIPYCTLLSEALNGQWDPAWNVFAVKLMDPTFDAVLVGYAFNNHWMWDNGYTYNGNSYAFVIWKDYNCKTWNTFSISNFLTPKTTSDPFYGIWQIYQVKIGVAEAKAGYPKGYTNIWLALQLVLEEMDKADPKIAYTFVGVSFLASSLSNPVPLEGRFCSSGGKESYVGGRSIFGSSIGAHQFAIIRTRIA
jgi:hypothetical protein